MQVEGDLVFGYIAECRRPQAVMNAIGSVGIQLAEGIAVVAGTRMDVDDMDQDLLEDLRDICDPLVCDVVVARYGEVDYDMHSSVMNLVNSLNAQADVGSNHHDMTHSPYTWDHPILDIAVTCFEVHYRKYYMNMMGLTDILAVLGMDEKPVAACPSAGKMVARSCHYTES